MALVRWTPFSELADMRREMQSLAGLMSSRFIPFSGEERFIPAMDVTTRGEDLLIRVELPAVDIEKDVDISVDMGVLRVSGKRSEERTEDKQGYYMREMRYGTFERTFPLPDGVGPEAVQAEYKDGVLEVTVTGGAKQMAQPEAQHIRITRGSGTQGGQAQMTQGEQQGQTQPQPQSQQGQQGQGQAGGQSPVSQGSAPGSWAPADTGAASSDESSRSQGSTGGTQVTPD